jgi:hypothetical protein
MQLERQQLLQIINMLEKGDAHRENLASYGLPDSEEEVLNFLDMASLENQPT